MSTDAKDLIGKTVASIEADDERVTIRTTDGRAFGMYHLQDCCEAVHFVQCLGSPINELVGKTVDVISREEGTEVPAGLIAPKDCYMGESFTWTEIRLVCGSHFFRFIWFGSSNGYYSESVYFEEVQS